ncbi:IS66 family transposase [Marinomonas mediterranea]|uniref:Transposase IS66 n=1 Tax=Marinomonas mediterranea (strain ATCC 700492 / JCM 21426 / NBRC 103028 / MMB-1) TaxID=717774 RepID=F2K177_MARM1|nr:IS66 family transposase [Marinomonas mediterranea]ADZ89927.1 transposase IS66 [Marinomonas mediterranea MMB-1]
MAVNCREFGIIHYHETRPDTLPNDVESLKKLLLEQQALLSQQVSEISEKDSQLAQWQSKYQNILEQWRLAQQRQFGTSSEVMPGQRDLFDETSEDELDSQVDDEQENRPPAKKRTQPKRKLLPKDLPRETVVLDIPEEEKVCDGCQGELHKMGEDKSEKLEFIPAQLKVLETVRPKYACRHCDQSGTHSTIKQREPEPSMIPKGIATPSLLAQIITGKFQYSLPLYRQETLFQQYGIELKRSTMSSWMATSAQVLQGLYHLLRQVMLQQSVLHADETTLQVIKEKRGSCYMWVYCSGKDSPDFNSPIPNIVLYDFQPSRAGACPKNFLSGYNGYLQVDGYAAYEQTEATLVGCWAHARRKFTDIVKTTDKKKTGKAQLALSKIQKLYAIESVAQQKETKEEAYQHRLKHAPTALEDYKAWLEKESKRLPPSSTIAKAVQYSLNQWDKLIQYLKAPELQLDNNRAERAIKPFVIGRKNWLFANTGNGAKSSAVLYSIIETAKANGLIPYEYLVTLFEELPKRNVEDSLEDLLPWSIKL